MFTAAEGGPLRTLTWYRRPYKLAVVAACRSRTGAPVSRSQSAPRGAVLPGGMRGPPSGLLQQAGEAGGSLTLEARGWVGAAPTTGQAGTATRPGSGKRGRKGNESEPVAETP